MKFNWKKYIAPGVGLLILLAVFYYATRPSVVVQVGNDDL